MNEQQGFSDAVHPKIQEAIERELSNRGGGMLTGFIAIFTYIDEDGDQCWSRVGQVPIITAVGMVDLLQMSVRAEAAQGMGFLGQEE